MVRANPHRPVLDFPPVTYTIQLPNPLMMFNLPANLKDAVASYDPAAVKAPKPPGSSTTAKPAPLGIVPDLLPSTVMEPEAQARLCKEMCGLEAPHRYRFTQTDTSISLVVNAKDRWIVHWFVKPGHPDHGKYIFGFTVTHKDTEARGRSFNRDIKFYRRDRETQTGRYFHLSNVIQPEHKTYGRIKICKYTALVDLDLLDKLNLNGIPRFDLFTGRYSSLCRFKLAAFQRFESALHSAVDPGDRTNSHLIFHKLRERNDVRRAIFGLDVDTGKTLAQLMIGELPEDARPVFDTPFFRKELNKAVEAIEREYRDNGNKGCFGLWDKKASLLKWFAQQYPDAQPDYLQRVWVKGEKASAPLFLSVSDWVRDNVPISSMVNMVEKCDKFMTLADTLEMIKRLALSKPNYKYEGRWRLTDLHNTVNSELFKVQTPNGKLPQDLFPTPINVGQYTFFQPYDIHQLGMWGQAVRNCVGNSSHYVAGVKSKKHLIVLVNKDNNPYYTVQLTVEDGVMHIRQIVKVANQRLAPSEKLEYSQLFGKALGIREKQIGEE